MQSKPVSSKCRFLLKISETVMHLGRGFPKLAQKQHKRRHDNVARSEHWELCKRYGLKCSEKWYEHITLEVMENDKVELYKGHDGGA